MHGSNGRSFACRQACKNWLHTHTNWPHAMAWWDDSRKRTITRKVNLHITLLTSVVRPQLSKGVQKKIAWSSLLWVQEHLACFWPSVSTTGFFLGQETTKPRLFKSSASTQSNRILPWSGSPGSFKTQSAYRSCIYHLLCHTPLAQIASFTYSDF